MATWEYISKRRGYVLETFVSGAKTLDDAIEIFRQKDVPIPQDGSLEALFEKKSVHKKDEQVPEDVSAIKKVKNTKKKKVAKDWGIVSNKEATKKK